MYAVDQFDAAAERECLAIARLAEMTDADVPQGRRVSLGRMVQLAAEKGVKPKAKPRYPRLQITKWWIGTLDSFAAGIVPKYDRELPLSFSDKARRHARRTMLAECAATLATVSPAKWLDMPTASRLSGLSVRRLQKLAQDGKLLAERRFISTSKSCPGKGTWFIRARDLRAHCSKRFGNAA